MSSTALGRAQMRGSGRMSRMEGSRMEGEMIMLFDMFD
jgi:hypothetical protein